MQGQYPPYEPKKETPPPQFPPNRPGCFTSALAGVGFFTVMGMLMFGLLIFFAAKDAGNKIDFSSFSSSEDGDESLFKVGVVELISEINDKTVRPAISALYKFGNKDEISAIVLRIESPGGSAAASQELYAAINEVRKKKRVVASMGSVAASGGYYVATAADKIFALPSTMTASIGVIAMTTEIKDLLEWMKMKPHTYKTGKYKDMFSPLRPPTADDEAMINAMLNDVYGQFIEDILKARPQINKEELMKIADGRVMTGRTALENKLVDAMGGLREAAAAALAISGITTTIEPKLVYPKESTEEWLKKFLAEGASSVVDGVVKNKDKSGVKLMYQGETE